ncbi:MAG: sugar kinase [Henriciella sp.]|nr:sugar kinase [Henriciella sp.]
MRVVCLGECMMELVHEPAGGVRLGFGGDTLNTAIYLRRLGVKTAYASALGADDPYSEELAAAWALEGLGLDFVARLPDRLPGLYSIRTDENGERSFYYWRSESAATQLFSAPNIDQILNDIAEADLLYLSGISLSIFDEAAHRRLADLASTVRAKGGQVAFDTNYRQRGWQDAAAARRTVNMLLPHVSIALPTFEDEQALFGDREPAETLDRLHAAGCGERVVKLGSAGCWIASDGDPVHVSAPNPLQPIDTTGAGDAFNAGYLAARLGGLTQHQAAKQGHRLAAAVIMQRGAIIPRELMPPLSEPAAC